ncbi:molybdenum cofactor guanylyltransferase [Domibacillus sp. DTU_2020_1001157_1_SI_ALB_TIR_016]|uniref:molybdenum cofactor guanylyltransferase n=1 Tax=Domibacillus sp. DTU_2020_1001157_1_SI_ALB_TIR_016 TaxID=3077789 RepID=UPI0028E73D3A|nr:molybdenum cofactor guanylyltransferase [Domibacillus sp. DTU_2020_1001157_1_SI_ALB_TIR_016]WNS80918.1 molybdenum cofactor guanylyltransferase [Domibacillus sp. DTU_2020_1001157_1_SI_ALB_TIR_016]
MKTAGIVLAGGQSSRYGRPKMFEQYKEKPFYQHSVDVLSANGLHPIILSTNRFLADRFDLSGVELIVEPTPHQGPLFALHHAISQFGEPEWFFVLSADIPFVREAFIDQLLLHCHPDYNAVVPAEGEKLQPLLALYHRRCLPYMNEALGEGRRSLMALLHKIPFKTVSFENEPSFININTQLDFQKHNKSN